MNKEQEKPQEEMILKNPRVCIHRCHANGNTTCCNECQEDWEKLTVLLKFMPDGGALIMQLIRTNFIAKRDLRKLLEGREREVTQEQNQYQYSQNIGYNSALNDIKAEIEKL